MKKIVLLLVLSMCMVACEAGDSDVPEPYKGQIVTLRNRSMDNARKCQDLQKQMADLQAESNWDLQRINSIANEALLKVGKSPMEYIVDSDKLTIRKREGSRH